MISALGQGLGAMSAQLAARERDRHHMRTRGPDAVHAAGIATKIGLSSGLPTNGSAAGLAHEDWAARRPRRKSKPKPTAQGRLGGLSDTGAPPLPPLAQDVDSGTAGLWQPSPSQLRGEQGREAKERRKVGRFHASSDLGGMCSPQGEGIAPKPLFGPLNPAHVRGASRHEFDRIVRVHENRHSLPRLAIAVPQDRSGARCTGGAGRGPPPSREPIDGDAIQPRASAAPSSSPYDIPLHHSRKHWPYDSRGASHERQQRHCSHSDELASADASAGVGTFRRPLPRPKTRDRLPNSISLPMLLAPPALTQSPSGRTGGRTEDVKRGVKGKHAAHATLYDDEQQAEEEQSGPLDEIADSLHSPRLGAAASSPLAQSKSVPSLSHQSGGHTRSPSSGLQQMARSPPQPAHTSASTSHAAPTPSWMRTIGFTSPRDAERLEESDKIDRFERLSREISYIFPSEPITPQESGMNAVMRAVATGHLHGVMWMSRDEDGEAPTQDWETNDPRLAQQRRPAFGNGRGRASGMPGLAGIDFPDLEKAAAAPMDGHTGAASAAHSRDAST